MFRRAVYQELGRDKNTFEEEMFMFIPLQCRRELGMFPVKSQTVNVLNFAGQKAKLRIFLGTYRRREEKKIQKMCIDEIQSIINECFLVIIELLSY